MKLKFNQNGFTAFELLFIAMVFSLMGVVGYLSYQNSQNKLDAALYPEFLSTGSAEASTLPQSKSTAAYVKQRVETIYATYRANARSLSSVENGAAIYSQGMLAKPYAQVVEKNNADDGFWCGDPVIPGTVVVSDVKLGRLSSAMAKHDTPAMSPSWQVLLVEYKNDWAIAKVACGR